MSIYEPDNFTILNLHNQTTVSIERNNTQKPPSSASHATNISTKQPIMTTQRNEADEREALKSRKLPEMILSRGDATSMTSPPNPLQQDTTAQEKAKLRFQVHGNAM